MKQTKMFTVEAEVPEGYEMTGELRGPRHGEYFLNSDGNPEECYTSFSMHRIILRKTERWRPATNTDIINALQGQVVKARFRDHPDKEWFFGTFLVGGAPGSNFPWASRTTASEGGYLYENYRYCEVLDV